MSGNETIDTDKNRDTNVPINNRIADAILSGMITVVGLRTADEPSVDYLRETIGTSFEKYTRNSGDARTPSESKEKEEYQFAKGDLRNFDRARPVALSFSHLVQHRLVL